ncbi:hypothetical protein DFH06DRAFT_772229 [Mycena polygramma]|nr:hypothetical protein DFH06DRAFT_772229 [Mycena polygramma]
MNPQYYVANPLPSRPLMYPGFKKDFTETLRLAQDTPDQLHEHRHNVLTSCSYPPCFESGKKNSLRLCGKCRIAPYCSTECQRADWPAHKGHCGPATSPCRLVQNFLGSRLLMYHFSLFLAVELDLEHKIPGTELPTVRMTMCMAPAEVLQLIKALDTGTGEDFFAATGDGAPWGILHLRNAYQQDVKLLGSREKKMLDHAKDCARTNGIDHKTHIVLVHFDGDDGQVLHYLVHISTEIVEIARKAEPLHLKSLPRGDFDIAFSKENILDQVNNIMRSDRANKFRVRARLTEKDVQIMKKAYPPHGIPLLLGTWPN